MTISERSALDAAAAPGAAADALPVFEAPLVPASPPVPAKLNPQPAVTTASKAAFKVLRLIILFSPMRPMDKFESRTNPVFAPNSTRRGVSYNHIKIQFFYLISLWIIFSKYYLNKKFGSKAFA